MILIYGASHDLIEVEGCEGADEFNTYERGPVMWRGVLVAPDRGELEVTALLPDTGCWAIAVGQVREELPLPNWPITIKQSLDCRYSTAVEIDAPAGTKLTDVWPKPEGDEP